MNCVVCGFISFDHFQFFEILDNYYPMVCGHKINLECNFVYNNSEWNWIKLNFSKERKNWVLIKICYIKYKHQFWIIKNEWLCVKRWICIENSRVNALCVSSLNFQYWTHCLCHLLHNAWNSFWFLPLIWESERDCCSHTFVPSVNEFPERHRAALQCFDDDWFIFLVVWFSDSLTTSVII